ncbi:MAG: carboxypeptidase M32 [Pseudomonadota bacterium]
MMTTNDRAARILPLVHELKDIAGVMNILSWDQETYMPAKAASVRAQQLATLQGIYHERLTAPPLGEAIATLEADPDATETERAMVRSLRLERDRAVKVPARLVRAIAETQVIALEAWREARRMRDFVVFRPHLEKLLSLKREQADAIGYEGERYNALLEAYEPGLRVACLGELFAALRPRLVSLVQAIGGSGRQLRNPLANRRFDPDKQWELTLRVLADMGFDFGAGRQDRSTHPFTGGANHPHDVRITTRIDPGSLVSGLMSSVHEAGHALYEQGLPLAHARTYLAQAPSCSVHESQSRFWENMIGRSLPFWSHYLPELRRLFGAELQSVSVEDLYAAVNTVRPSLIRVEADEVTYNLHVMVRFELELALLRDDLRPADLPDSWRKLMDEYLGVVPTSDLDGVLQDIHWACGDIGYFPSYTLGNIISAMLLEKMLGDIPALWELVGRGELRPIVEWQRANIHVHGFRYRAEELVERATGRRICESPFIDYLDKKYRPLYGI